jgi:zinc/manganese transport system substrate-binding protein
MIKVKLLFLGLALALIIALACQTPREIGAAKSIVVTYSILGSIVKDLVGDKATVTVSVPNGLDPHDWEPSARDIEAINKADLVVENGLGLESGMEKTLRVARDAGVKFFTVSDYINIRHVGPGEGIPSGDPDQAMGAADPHLWTDPMTMKSVVAGLPPALLKETGIDVSVGAADLEKRLDSLNSQVSGIIAFVPQSDRKLVTGHESMGYFAQRYGFKLVGMIVPSLSSQAEVSAADLAALKQAVQHNNVKAIFVELGTSPVVAQSVGQETGVRVVQLTTHALSATGSYSNFMLNMANVIANALK